MITVRSFENGEILRRGQQLQAYTQLSVRGAKGERVSFQVLYLSDKSGKADLSVKSDKNINIRTYIETFVNVTVPSCDALKAGEYADGMVEYDRAERVGLLDLEANKEYVALIQAEIPRNVDDEYTITVTCSIGGENASTCIKVIPYIFEFPKENHSKTCYLVWRDRNMILGSPEEQLKKYEELCEMLWDYKLNPHLLPYSYLGDIQKQIETMKKYEADDRVACYSVFVQTKKVVEHDQVVEYLDMEFFENLLSAMVENSTDEHNLFRKAYLHFTFNDEPVPPYFRTVRHTTDDVREMKKIIADKYDFSGKREVEKALLTLDDVVTIWNRETLYGNVDTWCPFYSAHFMAEYRHESNALRSLGAKHWWYGCNAPKFPFPNHHTDSPTIVNRIEPWMRYYENINGDLYWSVNTNHSYDEETHSYIRDLLEEPRIYFDQGYDDEGNKLPYCTLDVNGEGMMIYSETRYGKPFPSTKLNSSCEGQKEYEYLYLYDQLLNEAKQFYCVNFNPRAMLDVLFGTLIDHTMINCTYKELDAAKDEMAMRIECALENVFYEIIDDVKGVIIAIYEPEKDFANVKNGTLLTSVACGKGFKTTYLLFGESLACIEFGKEKKQVAIILPIIESVNICDIKKGTEASTVPPYIVNYWRKKKDDAPAWEAAYKSGKERRYDNGLIVQNDEGCFIKTKSFTNVEPPVFFIPKSGDYSNVSHVLCRLKSFSDRDFILHLNLIDDTGARYPVGYEYLASNRDCEIRYCLNRTIEKSLNRYYDLTSIWFPDVYTSHQKKIKEFHFDRIKGIELIVLNDLKLLDDTRELNVCDYEFILKDIFLEAIKR